MKRINLALQGGGAHGAFTWGALDRLLEEDDIEIAAISGTSAGALNGAALKSGLVSGGREGAKEQLRWVWSSVGAITHPALAKWMEPFAEVSELYAHALNYSPAYIWWDTTMRMISPYSNGAVLQNPLGRVLGDLDWEALLSSEGPELHVCATNVRTGKIRIFTDTEISPDAILASACLPTLFEAVEIDDPQTGQREAFWDGGFTAIRRSSRCSRNTCPMTF